MRKEFESFPPFLVALSISEFINVIDCVLLYCALFPTTLIYLFQSGDEMDRNILGILSVEMIT